VAKIEPLIKAEDYNAFQSMMPKEPAFKDAPTGTFIDFASFSTREKIRIQSGMKPNEIVILVAVEPGKFEQYCTNYDKDRTWLSLKNFADAKFEMSIEEED